MELLLLISNLVLDFLLLIFILLVILFLIIATKMTPDEDDFHRGRGKTSKK